MRPSMICHLVLPRERFRAPRKIAEVPLFAAMNSFDVSWDVRFSTESSSATRKIAYSTFFPRTSNGRIRNSF